MGPLSDICITVGTLEATHRHKGDPCQQSNYFPEITVTGSAVIDVLIE